MVGMRFTSWASPVLSFTRTFTDSLIRKGIRLRVVSSVFHRLLESVPFEQINGLPVMEVGATPLRGAREVAKRIFDIAGAIVGSVVILPLLLGIALAIRLTSKGPVLYRQTRLGRGGRAFTFYKFRSMLHGENESTHREYIQELLRHGRAAGNNGAGQPVYKFVDGARLTPIGRWLRRTSLDELPQLINVIRGEMSLIGPRPCVPFEYELYKDWQKGRLDVTPGMTGLWQVTGRSLVTFEDQVLMDLFYIANWSFLLDLKLLARTIPVVIWGKGGL
jgi:exopolysaccharide biosynthesis polyprenyl glycosylphosphotransferase